MASVYILFSEKVNRFYTGSCLYLNERIADHLSGKYSNSYTIVAKDWKLYFSINDLDEYTARKIESHIKRMRSTKYIADLLKYPEMTEKLILRFSVSKK